MEKPAHYGVDRAGIYLNVCGVGEILYLHSILLSSEYQGYEVCSAKIGGRVQEYLLEILVYEFEMYIMQSERVLDIPCCIDVFPRAEEEIERHPDAVDGGTVTRI